MRQSDKINMQSSAKGIWVFLLFLIVLSAAADALIVHCLFPRLQGRVGFHGACLLSGGIWAVWHYPGLLWADYNAGTNAFFAISCFTIMVIAMGYIMGWLRTRSGSVWPCVVLHATHNTFVQTIFDPLTSATGLSKYITTEFGAGLAAAMIVTAIAIVSVERLNVDDSLVRGQYR